MPLGAGSKERLLKYICVGIPLLLVSGCSYGVFSIFGGMCNVTTDYALPSPSGHIIATVEHTDCGATTGYNTRVVLKRESGWFSSDEKAVLILDDRYWNGLPIHWEGENRLNIQIVNPNQIREYHASVWGVNVIYHK